MRISAKRVKLALRSPSHFRWAARHVLRNSPVGTLERKMLNGRALAPDVVAINITSRCNLRCAMCMQPRGEGDDSPTLRAGRDELTPEQWCNVVDKLASARPAFYFSGGEPLLYKGIDTILERVKKYGMITALVTNGTALRQRAERLVAIGVDNITISLDGPDPVHDAIRGVPGTFQRTIEGIRALQDARRKAGKQFPAIKVNCVITAQSIPTLAETARVVEELGIEELNLQHPIYDTHENIETHNRVFPKAMRGVAPLSEGTCDEEALKQEGEFYDCHLSEEEYGHLREQVREIEGRNARTKISYFPEVPRGKWAGYYMDMNFPFERRCNMPWRMMRLLADGTFEPCLHFAVGNVAETSPLDLWNCRRMRGFRRALMRDGLWPACVRCCYRSY